MFKIDLKGIDKELAKLQGLPKRLQEDVGDEISAAAQQWVKLAQVDAPKDVGNLYQAIGMERTGVLQSRVFVNSEYGVYLEFGTKGNYRQIPGTEEYVKQFQSRSPGTWKEFIKNIVRWVHRKGIAGTYSVKTRRRTGSKSTQQEQDYTIAFLIARSIYKNGIRPHPYFFKQREIVLPEMIARMKQKINSYD